MYLKKIGYGKTRCPYECPFYNKKVEYKEGQFPVAEKVKKEVFWLTDALPILGREDLDDMVAAIEKVAAIYGKRTKH